MTLTYKATVDTSQAERNLSNLQKSVGGLNDTFIRLKSTLATISLGAVITQALQYADAISDLSDASGIAIGNIIGFQNAVMASGGSAEGAQKAILKLVNAIGEAADGNEETQKSFKAVGVTISDLRKLSEQEILKKTIDGLDKITDNGKRSIAVTALLGKEFRNVAVGGLGAAYAQATAESAKYADAIAKGAAAQQNIDKTLGEFKLGLLEAIKPFTELISKVNIGVDNFQRFVQALLAVGALLATIFVGGKIIAGARILYGVFLALFEAVSGGISILINFVRNFEMIMANVNSASSLFSGLRAVISAVGSTLAEILAPAFGALKSIAMPVLAGIAGYWGWIQDSTSAAIDKLREYANILSFGLIDGPDTDARSKFPGRGDPKEIANREAAAAAAKKAAADAREVRDKAAERAMERLRKYNEALEKQRITYMQLNDNQRTFSNYLESDLKFQTRKLSMTEDEKELADALHSETNRYLGQQNSLQDKLSSVQSEIGIELASQKKLKDDELAASKDKVNLLKDEEIKLKELSKTYYDLHISNGKAIESEIGQQQRIRNTEADRVRNLEYTTDRLKEQADAYETLAGIIRSINDKAVDLKFDQNLKKLSPLRQEIAKIREDSRKAALGEIRTLGSQFSAEDGITPEQAQVLADGVSEITRRFDGLRDSQIDALGASKEYLAGFPDVIEPVFKSFLEFSEEFRIGTKDAFTKFKEDAMDAGKQAANSFNNFTSGMEDAFVEFAKTGKLSFKSLADSIIADLIRIAVRKAIVAAIGGPLGSLFGFAQGGSAMAGTPVIVGERGPELFVPSSAGKVIPNNVLNGSAAGQGAVNGGGQTMVTYNIQAVDASSFRSLVARDPSFMFAVTEQGRRSQPTRSR